MEYAHSDGIRLAYELEGNGVPLYIPVFANQQTMRMVLSERLREHFQLVFCHHRGSWTRHSSLTTRRTAFEPGLR